VRVQQHDEGLVRGNLAAKIRVHELAKELGLTNKECLDLALDMGIGVKTHSSGIEEAQADRVRRRAERDGLIRDEQPQAAPAKKKTKGSDEAAPAAGEKPASRPRPVHTDGDSLITQDCKLGRLRNELHRGEHSEENNDGPSTIV
jgi:hypothetical protein